MRKIRRFFFIIICLFLLAGSMMGLAPRAYAASSMTTSEACIEFIKQVEGFSAQPYFDYSQYTVGYGTKCPTEKFFDYKANGIPKKEAEALLLQELANVENDINSKFIDKYQLTLSQSQFDALVSFSFNIGTGWITYDSSLRNAILSNASDNDLVYAFGLYCTADGKYLPGLVTRRLCEANMYLNGVYSQTMSDAFGYVYYDATGGSVTYRVQAFICNRNSAPAADASKSGDVFLGWYTDLTGGTQVTALNRALTGNTLFARWKSSETVEESGSEETSAIAMVKVTGDVVNIRSGPGTNYGTVKQVYRNTVLTVSHVTHLTNMKWGKIPDGWICLDYTNYDTVISGSGDTDAEPPETDAEPPEEDIVIPETQPDWNEPDAEDPTDQQMRITGYVDVDNYLNIRSGPGTTYSTVGFLFRNTKVDILEQKKVGATVWGRMEKGWVCMDYIVTDIPSTEETTAPVTKPEKEPQKEETGDIGKIEAAAIHGKITADALRVRSGPGTANPIVGFYYQNDFVTISEKVLVGSDYWGKTGKGWISLEYVLPVSAATEPSQPVDNDEKTVIADCLRVRKEPGTENKIVAFLYYGDTVTVLETKDVNGTVWGRVEKGWISMDYVN